MRYLKSVYRGECGMKYFSGKYGVYYNVYLNEIVILEGCSFTFCSKGIHNTAYNIYRSNDKGKNVKKIRGAVLIETDPKYFVYLGEC